MKLIDAKVDYTLGKTIYNFENLFNGNKRIGINPSFKFSYFIIITY